MAQYIFKIIFFILIILSGIIGVLFETAPFAESEWTLFMIFGLAALLMGAALAAVIAFVAGRKAPPEE